MQENSQRAFGPPSKSGAQGRSRTRRGGILATLIAAAFALALVTAPGAGAIGFSESGSFSSAEMNFFTRSIAVDPQSGNVYLGKAFTVAPEPGTILRFDATGAPLSPASMGSSYYTGVAVEQGGDHTVYAYNSQYYGGVAGTPSIGAFDTSGSALGSPFPFDVDASAGQIASDAAGNIYFPDTATNTVKKYTSAGAAGTPAEFSCTGTDCNSTALNSPRGAAVDQSGNVYVADFENNRVVKFNPDGSYDSVFYEGAAGAIAVDTSAEMILVAGDDGAGQHITALDYDGNVIGKIPTTDLTGTLLVWMAVNPSTETLYVLKVSPSSQAVAIYDIVATPGATTGAATAITATSATLSGTANPKGVLSEECRFEYTTDADFGANEWANAQSAPCSPQPFNEETDVAVTANISGLSGGTTYQYRVVEETEAATGEGAAEQFTTLVPPSATTGAASAITQHAATLAGTVNPNGEASTDCHIEWGPAAGNYSGGQASCSPAPGSAATDTAISAAASGLAAGTTYHYRVVQKTAAGTANGLDKSFTTLADTCAANAALCPPPPPPTGGGGSTPPPAVTPTPAPVKPLTCKKGFKKKKVHGKARCVKIKHKKHKKH